MSKITDIHALQILDSRGNPTIRTYVTLASGIQANASVPSGASTGSHEAIELRDTDPTKYNGQGVLKAVENVNHVIKDAVMGMDITDPKVIDEKMIELDGTENKFKLGANAILSLSLAVMRAYAMEQKKPLWQAINEYYFPDSKPSFPKLMVNIVNGGKHANWAFDMQEFIISPVENKPSESIRIASEIFHSLGNYLREKKLSTLAGDEGGYAPDFPSNEAVFEAIIQSAKTAGYENVKDFRLAIDSAASEFYENGKYVFRKTGVTMTGEELTKYYTEIGVKNFIMSFEDPFAEDDWESFIHFTQMARQFHYMVVGDDLYCTNPERLKKGITEKASTAILIKPNQIGTLMETAETIQLAKDAGMEIAISHRSGETEDSFIADLAYGSGADFMKAGSMSRSERLAKYNRLLEIEQGL